MSFFEIFAPGLKHMREERDRQKTLVTRPTHGGAGGPLGIDLDSGKATFAMPAKPDPSGEPLEDTTAEAHAPSDSAPEETVPEETATEETATEESVTEESVTGETGPGETGPGETDAARAVVTTERDADATGPVEPTS